MESYLNVMLSAWLFTSPMSCFVKPTLTVLLSACTLWSGGGRAQVKGRVTRSE